jgi:hypothetical protein
MYSARQYDPTISVTKGATEGGIAGSVAVLLGVAMATVRSGHELPWDVTTDAAIVGAATGLLAGAAKWFRNRRKHK